MTKARDIASATTPNANAALLATFPHRNLIINGAMQVAQRGASFTNLGNGDYGLDRFQITKITGGEVDINQTDDAPTALEAGYLLTKCLQADVTTADTSVANSDMYSIRQRIEYKNIAHVGFGQSGTRYVTASFWVKSTKTGIFCCYFKTSNHTRAYTKEYTISVSNTWQYVTLTFPVDTSNSSAWNHNDTGGMLGWVLYGGTDYHITADTWTTTTNNYAPCTSNQVNALDSASNDFKITGVQLELGDTATPFEHRSFGDELAMCQRYFCRTYEYGTATGTPTEKNCLFNSLDATQGYARTGTFTYPLSMRATPTVVNYNTNNGASGQISADASNHSAGAGQIGQNRCHIGVSGITIGASVYVKAHATADAEL